MCLARRFPKGDFLFIFWEEEGGLFGVLGFIWIDLRWIRSIGLDMGWSGKGVIINDIN